MEHMSVLLVIIGACLLLTLYTGFRMFMIVGRIRRENKKSFETALRVVDDWEKFAARAAEERQRMTERLAQFETATRDRVDQFEEVAAGTRDRLIKLEQYLKEFFEVELKAVFESFDKTVASILEEMKAELLRGVDRIEEIQAVVDSKSFAQDRILDGRGSVYKLLTHTGDDGDEAGEEPGPEEAAPRDEEEAQQESQVVEPENPPLRLDGDELG